MIGLMTRLRGYSNVNLALILTSASGWQVMGYLKNVFDTTAITGDFLNSDDSGLTTNVFLTDPRLYRRARHEELVRGDITMSELIQKNDDRATIRWKLLTSASASGADVLCHHPARPMQTIGTGR